MAEIMPICSLCRFTTPNLITLVYRFHKFHLRKCIYLSTGPPQVYACNFVAKE
uniref:Uncharacterized protein n=1 Tax=Rhizophora mucronata TaxID=61149 RepID=A0A2P2P9N0_RHIMU